MTAHAEKKVSVSSVPDPPVGVWRCITNPVIDPRLLDGWAQHIVGQRNDIEIRERTMEYGIVMYELWARKKERV